MLEYFFQLIFSIHNVMRVKLKYGSHVILFQQQLFFKIQKEYWTTLKSFLLYLNILREDELKDIEEDGKVQQVLKEL